MISLVPKFLTEVIWKLHPRYWEHKKAVEELLDFAKRVNSAIKPEIKSNSISLF